jgi:neogenin
MEDNPTMINLNWQPPKQPNGQITGYVIFYTTDNSQRDRDWVVEAIVGDKMTTLIKGLTLDTTYFFKIQARNNKGYGPLSPLVTCRAGAGKPYDSQLSFFYSEDFFFILIFDKLLVIYNHHYIYDV